MAQHDDLEVLGATGAYGEPNKAGDELVQKARHSRSGSTAFPLVNPHGRIFGPHRLGGPRDGDRAPPEPC